jgi:hypothetical protein
MKQYSHQRNYDTVVSFSKNRWREKLSAHRRKIDINAEPEVQTRCGNVATTQSGHVEAAPPPLLKEHQDG